jgi:hypothetical protein
MTTATRKADIEKKMMCAGFKQTESGGRYEKANFNITSPARNPRLQLRTSSADLRQAFGSGEIKTIGRLQVRRDR